MINRISAIALLIGGSVLALAIGSSPLGGAITPKNAAHLNAPHNKVIYGDASYLCCNNFVQLVKSAPVIVEARVVAQLPSYGMPTPAGTPDTAPQPTIDPSILPPVKATAIAAYRAHAVTPVVDTNQGAPSLILTDSTVEVIVTLKGAILPGQRLTIVQPGGELQGWRYVDNESPLLAVGSTEVLFLIPPSQGQSLHSDAYQIAEGSQARFSVQTDGTVSPFSSQYSYLSSYRGRVIESLKAEVRAAS